MTQILQISMKPQVPTLINALDGGNSIAQLKQRAIIVKGDRGEGPRGLEDAMSHTLASPTIVSYHCVHAPSTEVRRTLLLRKEIR